MGLVLFLQTLDLLATANEVLAGGGDPLPSLARYVMLRLPSLVETVAPLAALLGALTAMVGMATTSEILAMRAAGRERPIVADAPGAFGPAHRVATSARIIQATGVRFRSLAEGMIPTVAWYSQLFSNII